MWSSRFLLFSSISLLLLTACGPTATDGPQQGALKTETAKSSGETIFREVAAEVGLEWTHANGRTGEFYFPEIMGAGGAFLDYDGDGDLDVYLVQGNDLSPGGDEPASGPHMDRLYRNDGSDGKLKFTDVTQAAGLNSTGYGMGVTTGDYDGDGHLDIYVLNFGPNRLYRNRGDGTFEDVTAASGSDDPRWSAAGAFVDYDRDGFLDLFVVNYVDFTLENNKPCYRQVRDYCSPQSFKAVPDRLLRNKGDGTFEDVSAAAGIGLAYGNGLGVVADDFDGDGLPDFYVTNDGNANQLWRNKGDGTLEDIALISGTALNLMGVAEAGMGVDAGDFDLDGDLDLFMTHLRGETNTLYVNDGNGNFQDRTINMGLESPSQPYTGFGTGWFDYDNDGLPDLLAVNGEVSVNETQIQAGSDYPYAQLNQLFHNKGGNFSEVGAESGMTEVEISRGAAFGDVDNDGDVDVLVTNTAGPVRLYLNQVGNKNQWLGLDLAQGAVVRALLPDGRLLRRTARGNGSYGSANDPRVLLGLGQSDHVQTLTVTWPDGSEESWSNLPAGSHRELVKGSGGTAAEPLEAKPLAAAGESAGGNQVEVALTDSAVEPFLPDLSDLEPSVAADLDKRWQALQKMDPEDVSGAAYAQAFGDMGRRLHAYEFREAAQACYARAAAILPGFRWFYLRGILLRDLGRLPESDLAFAEAYKRKKNDVPLLVALGERALGENRLEEAEAHFKRATELNEGTAAAWIGLGNAAFVGRDFTAAVEHYQRGLRLDPTASSVHYQLAQAYRNLGKNDLANQHLTRRGEGRPSLVDPLLAAVRDLKGGARALRQKGEAAAGAGRLQEARTWFSKAVAAAPHDAQAWLNLAEVERLLGRKAEAVSALEKLTGLAAPGGTKATAYTYLGELRGEGGDDERAVEHLQTALALDPGQLAPRFHLADALRRLGRYDAAVAAYGQVIKQVPNNPASRFGRLFSLIPAGRWQDALAAAEDDVRALPAEPSFRHILARLLAAVPDPGQRDPARAKQLLDGLDRNMMDSGMAASYAMTFAAMGDFKQAKEWQERAVAMAGQRREAAPVLAALQRNLSRYNIEKTAETPWPADDPLFKTYSFRPGR